MNYFHSAGPDAVRDYLVTAIQTKLQSGRRVLFLVSGGSTIDIAVQTIRFLPGRGLTGTLAIAQVDERFGEVGHSDSNWKQMLDRGLDVQKFPVHPILFGANLDQTTDSYHAYLTREITRSNFIVALFGIGVDGHTAGILPDSPALDETEKFVSGYISSPFSRVTITPPFFPYINLAVAYAGGSAKEGQLERLKGQYDSAAQPAQLLKQAKETCVFIN